MLKRVAPFLLLVLRVGRPLNEKQAQNGGFKFLLNTGQVGGGQTCKLLTCPDRALAWVFLMPRFSLPGTNQRSGLPSLRQSIQAVPARSAKVSSFTLSGTWRSIRAAWFRLAKGVAPSPHPVRGDSDICPSKWCLEVRAGTVSVLNVM